MTELQADTVDDGKAWLEHGHALTLLGDAQGAHNAFRKAYAVAPTRDAAHALAASLRAQGNPTAALTCLENVCEGRTHFVSEADLLLERGYCLEELDRTDEALATFAAAAELRPALVRARVEHGRLLADKGKTGQAEVVARSLIADVPGFSNGWELLGGVLFDAGRLEEARDALRTAIDIDPEAAIAGHNLAIVEDRLGHPVTARRTMRAALSEARDNWATDELRAAWGLSPSGVEPVPDLDGGVLHVVPHFGGGAATVVTDLVKALVRDHRQAVLTLSSGALGGEAHQRRLERLDVPLLTAPDATALNDRRARARPGVVVHHYWPTAYLEGLERLGSERLIVRSAAPLPMPEGYDRYVALSEFQLRMQGHLPCDRVAHIPNGVDIARFADISPDQDAWAHAKDGTVRVAVLSRLDPDKIPRRLLQILAQVEGNISVAIAGRGARRHQMQHELSQFGLGSSIRFLGPIPVDGVPGYLAGADILLHLTETHQESHSLTVLEAMAAGLPVVAQPRGCLPEMIEPGVTGLLCASEDEIVAAISLLVTNPGMRRRMGIAARDAVRRYDAAQFAKSWRRLISKELGA